MNNLDIKKLADLYLSENKNGMSFSQIRKKLEEQNIPEDQIKLIIRSMDDEIFKKESIKSNNSKAIETIGVGAFLMLFGLSVTISVFFHIIDVGNTFVIAHGPIIIGLGIMISGIGKYRKNQ